MLSLHKQWAARVSLVASTASSPAAREVEEVDGEYEFVEVGVVISRHGIRGELLIRSTTDFPEERFEKPGLRWFRVMERGKLKMECMELLSGRNRPGKLPCWLVKLKGVTTPEQAAKLVGASMLVKRGDRPPLEEGDFYTPDLKGMEVIEQSTGETVGLVDDVFNFGAQDVLRVQRTDGHMIWIPFVEAIVPEVHLTQRKMMVKPPDGLLELNIPKATADKPAARKEGLKARRKLQERVSGLKKSLAKCKQDHLLASLNSSGSDKEQRDMLLRQLLSVDFKSLLPSFHRALGRSKSESRHTGFTEIPQIHVADSTQAEAGWWKQGLQMIAENSVAVVSSTTSPGIHLRDGLLEMHARRLLDVQKSAAMEFPDPDVKCQIPWFIMTSSDLLEPLLSVLEKNDFFGLDRTQVCPLVQEAKPVFDIDEVDEVHRVQLETPSRVREALTGDGGSVQTLLLESLVDEFHEKGVGYVQLQVCDVDNARAGTVDPELFGFAYNKQSELSLKVVPWRRGNRGEVIGFSSAGGGKYDLVIPPREPDSDCVVELSNAVSPTGNYVLSVEFLKAVQSSACEFELQARPCVHGQAKGLVLEYPLLDNLISRCRPGKLAMALESKGLNLESLNASTGEDLVDREGMRG